MLWSILRFSISLRTIVVCSQPNSATAILIYTLSPICKHLRLRLVDPHTLWKLKWTGCILNRFPAALLSDGPIHSVLLHWGKHKGICLACNTSLVWDQAQTDTSSCPPVWTNLLWWYLGNKEASENTLYFIICGYTNLFNKCWNKCNHK